LSKKKFYPNKARLKEELIDFLETRYAQMGFEVQTFKAREEDAQGYIFQARKQYSSHLAETASKLTGLDLAASVKIRQFADSLDIEVGGGKWLDKAAVAGFGLFVAFSLLVIPAGIGALKQHNLIEDIYLDVEDFCNNPEQFGAGKEVKSG